MKGYANITTEQMYVAVTNWKRRYELGGKLLDKGIDLYYEKYYTNGSWLTRWWHRKDSPIEFSRSRLNMFSSWDQILYEVLSEDETELLAAWCWDRHKDAYKAVSSLLKCSTDGTALLDDKLCWFVDKYK